jgi:hypothetical protein
MKTSLIVLAVAFLVVLAVTFLGLSLAGRDKPQADPEQEAMRAWLEQKTHLLFESNNARITAYFYGKDNRFYRTYFQKEKPFQVIEYIELKDKRSGQAVTYAPDCDTRQAADFFFPNIWSPDGAYIVLPLDKFDGFAIFNSETAIQDIKSHKYADTIRVWRGEARRYWHNFDVWEGHAAFYFKGEMEGHTFRFKYDIPARRLSCFDAGCSSDDRARNIKGDLLAIKMKTD